MRHWINTSPSCSEDVHPYPFYKRKVSFLNHIFRFFFPLFSVRDTAWHRRIFCQDEDIFCFSDYPWFPPSVASESKGLLYTNSYLQYWSWVVRLNVVSVITELFQAHPISFATSMNLSIAQEIGSFEIAHGIVPNNVGWFVFGKVSWTVELATWKHVSDSTPVTQTISGSSSEGSIWRASSFIHAALRTFNILYEKSISLGKSPVWGKNWKSMKLSVQTNIFFEASYDIYVNIGELPFELMTFVIASMTHFGSSIRLFELWSKYSLDGALSTAALSCVHVSSHEAPSDEYPQGELTIAIYEAMILRAMQWMQDIKSISIDYSAFSSSLSDSKTPTRWSISCWIILAGNHVNVFSLNESVLS